jgi:uncharacterized protein (DUF1330 family)
MAAYAVVNVRQAVENAEMLEYRNKVEATLELYAGRFLARGGAVEVQEGDWKPERLVVIEFPSLRQARGWYQSPEYQAIIRMRTRNSETDFVFLEGC